MPIHVEPIASLDDFTNDVVLNPGNRSTSYEISHSIRMEY